MYVKICCEFQFIILRLENNKRTDNLIGINNSI